MAWGPFNAGSGGAQSGGGTAKEIAYEDTLGISASNIQEALDKVLGNTLPKLTVTTTAGSALTITDGQSTITGTATGGSFTATLPRLGEWTVTASLAGSDHGRHRHCRCRGRSVYAQSAVLRCHAGGNGGHRLDRHRYHDWYGQSL